MLLVSAGAVGQAIAKSEDDAIFAEWFELWGRVAGSDAECGEQQKDKAINFYSVKHIDE